MNPVTFGIIGCGAIADFHAKALNSISDARLIGAFDQSEQSAKGFCAKYGIRQYASYQEMLSDSLIDAVCICTPSGFHSENAIIALENKKHVVLEKPMAFTVEEASKIKKAADKSGRLLTVISQLRFSEDILYVKKLISENALGKLVFCDLYMKYWRSPEYFSSSTWRGTLKFDGGGALMNQGIHGVDLLLYLAGEATVKSALMKTVYHNIEVEDAIISMLQFDNGALGTIEASTCCNPGFERTIEITGTEGSVILKENAIESLIIKGETIINRNELSIAHTSSDPTNMSCDQHRKQLENFINGIYQKEAIFVDYQEGLKAISLIEQIYKKANG